jgi:putative peptidoglycan lipid II flippase
VVAGVLGTTYFGNTFVALNSLPNLVYYDILAGSLFISVLVPALVVHHESGRPREAQDLVAGFLGLVLLGTGAAALLLLVGGWVLVHVMADGVSDPAVAGAQRHVGLLLLITFVPQVVLYGVAGVGSATMNAKRRFALPAAAPAVENIAIIACLIVTAAVFGPETDILKVGDGKILILGLGATVAVLLHAGLQSWGAQRAGVTMRPSRGWANPEVRAMVRRMRPAMAYSALGALQVVVFLVASNRVAGGVVALQLSLNFFYLPLALVAWPIARALLPQLARPDAHEADHHARTLHEALGLASFVAIPIAVAYIALSFPLARFMAFGKLGAHGTHLLGWSIAAIAPAVVAETWFVILTYAFYARSEMRAPLGAMGLRVGVSIALLPIALLAHGDGFLPLLCLALSCGSFVGAWRLHHVLGGGEDGARNGGMAGSGTMVRVVVASVVCAGPMWLAAHLIGDIGAGKLFELAALLAAGAVGVAILIGMHKLLRSPELGWISGSLPGRGGVGRRTSKR